MNESNLPKGWVEVQLIELLKNFENGSRPSGGVQGIIEGIPSLGGEHINNSMGINYKNMKYVPFEFAEKLSKGEIKQNDILIVKDGATTGKTAFISKNFKYKKAFVNEHVFICRLFENINSKIVFYFLFSQIGQFRILENFTGTAQGGINKKFASNTLIPLPPKAEQERMVEKLDALFGQLEILKTHLQTVPQLLKDFRQSVLNQAVTGKLKMDNGKLKVEEWKETTLGEISSVVRGGSPRPAGDPKFYGGDIPFVKVKDITKDSNKFLESYEYTITEAGLRKTRQLKKNTVLLTNSGATLGVPKITNFNITINDGVAAFLNLKNSSEDYLYYFLLTQTENFRNINKGAAQPNLNTDIIKNWFVLLPPLSEQEEIVKKVESLLTKAEVIEQKYLALKQEIDALPQSILAKAFRGELVPQLPTDGSAKDLLEEIAKLKQL